MAWHLSSTTSPFPKAETAPREIIDLICMVFEWKWTWLGLKETLLSKQWARTMPSTAAISRTKNFCVKPSDKRESWKIANPLSRAQHNSLKRLKAKSRNADAMQIMLKLKQKINFNHPYFKRTRSLVWSPENNDRLLTRYRQFVGHTVWFKITNTKFPPLYGSQKLLLINEVPRNLVFVSDQTCPLNTLTWNFFPAFWIVNLFFHTASLELSVNWK